MKNLINIWQIRTVILFAAITLVYSACKKENNTGAKEAPVLEKVTTLTKNDTTFKEIRIGLDSNRYANVITKVANGATVTGARWNAQYMLIGKNLKTTMSVSINGVPVFFNPAFVTESSLIFTVGTDVPYGSQYSNKLKVTTQYGAAEYDFGLLQPFPVITSVSPLLGEVGGTITIAGNYFENLKKVLFGTTEAEIIGTPTSKEIKIKIPAGISQANVTVSTEGGSSVSTNSFFAFKKILYQDGWASGMTSYGGWGDAGGSTPDNTAGGVRGSKSILLKYTASSCPLQFAYTGPALSLSNFTSLKLSIYGGTGAAGKKVKIQLNGLTNYTETLTLTEGAFTDYVIPLSNFPVATSTANFSKIWVIEGSNVGGYSVYVDEIGFL
ncbi:IPT/TIG domain-containing protein [Pedobacter sp. MC2016-14]|uniref:IPT/TIG domain-containing protein n=1 Tax=Pedobacter sp. MC2016-14 TaxID=2897327 RepID=UPI001E48E864|nr:IPT/TIG domain-containing protein [Pedobacter sp. MC2016-14]MCD0487573.1 IPT/TIG domain-containing protein [Pedobacter sp. MC2016-14]